MKFKELVTYDYCVTSIAATSIPNHQIGFRGEEVCYLALSLVTPLGTYDHYRRHRHHPFLDTTRLAELPYPVKEGPYPEGLDATPAPNVIDENIEDQQHFGRS